MMFQKYYRKSYRRLKASWSSFWSALSNKQLDKTERQKYGDSISLKDKRDKTKDNIYFNILAI